MCRMVKINKYDAQLRAPRNCLVRVAQWLSGTGCTGRQEDEDRICYGAVLAKMSPCLLCLHSPQKDHILAPHHPLHLWCGLTSFRVSEHSVCESEAILSPS